MTLPTILKRMPRTVRVGIVAGGVAEFIGIQEAVNYCDNEGGAWTIEVYTGVNYDEGDITPNGGADITLKGMGYGRAIIGPTAAPTTAVIVSGFTLTLDNIEVIAPDATRPALRVEGGQCTLTNSPITGDVAGNAIEQVAGRMDIYHSNILAGAIDLSTAPCNFNIYRSSIYGGVTVAAEALAHTLWFDTCYFHNLDIQSLATGATTCTVTNSTYLDQITNAGTGIFYINGTSVSRINQTNVTGSTRVYGGYVWQITRAVGSVIWRLDETTLKVIPSQTNTDTVIQWAVDFADSITGSIGILVHAGLYREGEITPSGAADISIQAMGEEEVVIHPAGAPATAAIVSGHTLTLVGMTVNAFSNANPPITVNGGTLILKDCDISGVGTGDAIAMIAGQVNAYRTTIHIGDVDLSTNDCILNMYYCRLVTDPIDTAGNLIHQITLVECDVNYQDIVSAATGGTLVSIIGCSNVGTVSNAGTGAFTIRDSDVDTVTASSTGPISLFGGYLSACGGATAAVTWEKTTNHYDCVPGMNINDSLGAGRYIFLHPGTFTHTVAVNVAVNNVTIAGSGRMSILTTTTADLDIITASACTGLVLRDFQIDGDLGGVACDMGIYLSNVDESKIIDVYVQDCGEDCIMLEDCDHTEVQHCYCDNSTEHGLYLLSCIRCKVIGGYYNNNTLDGIHIRGDATGNSDYNTVSSVDCTVNGSDGIEVSEAGAGQANKNIIIGCQLLGNTGVNLNDGGTNTEVGHNITV